MPCNPRLVAGLLVQYVPLVISRVVPSLACQCARCVLAYIARALAVTANSPSVVYTTWACPGRALPLCRRRQPCVVSGLHFPAS
ncbi:hypothetical protein BC826DRAFT_1033294 [Russula brevipes]|nr:hypothetical protein BC826DRAFT_1033294 [Russula brevipes]